ncbi:non-ribosomal peptide synthetase [Streptomyces sp. E2N166]|uniref:non-ribosomal peptide synthetase n=1 Tax=Streptomyces sp. E2N166 TaxID=1851909 RepID=UPI000EF6CFA0|nr:non-ribosomal peptide synthetase [Streptomyces sp. E2N166]
MTSAPVTSAVIPPLYALLRRRARLVPDAVAVTRADTSLTYRELFDQAGRLSRLLRLRDLPPGALVGLRLPPGPDVTTGLLGVLGAGAAFTVLDPDGPPYGDMVLDSADLALDRATFQVPLPAPPADPERPVCAVTGLGGTPSALLVEGDLTRALLAERDALGLAPGDTVLHRTPLQETFGVVEVLLTLLSGSRLAVPDTPDHDDIAAALDTMTQQHATHTRLPAAMLLDSLALSSITAFHLLRAGFSHKVVWTSPDLDAVTRARIEARTRFPLRPIAGNAAEPFGTAAATALARLLTPPPFAPPVAEGPGPAGPDESSQACAGADPTVVRAVIQCWQEVLEHTGVTAHDDFFALGGNSLTAVLVTDALAGRLGHDIPVDLLFRHRTPAAYAAALATAHRTDRTRTPPAPTEGNTLIPTEGDAS